jgi:F-type H+-transporting ATPase subunit gamma
VELGLSVCFRQVSPVPLHPYGGTGAGVIGTIVFGSDQGLVGQFNEAVAAFTQEKLAAIPGKKRIWAVGERIQSRLEEAGLPLAGRFGIPSSVAAIASLVGQLQLATEAIGDGACTEMYVFHARPISEALYEPIAQRLLPLDAPWQKNLIQIHWPTNNLPEVFGRNEVTSRSLIREYLFISLFKACAESLASENASRLAAMQRAEKNIGSLRDNLNTSFYRLRQSSIDEELFDVIAGFNALSSPVAAALPSRILP